MSSVTKKSNFGVAQVILFLSIAILVIVVAVPVLLILFNAWQDAIGFTVPPEICDIAVVRAGQSTRARSVQCWSLL